LLSKDNHRTTVHFHIAFLKVLGIPVNKFHSNTNTSLLMYKDTSRTVLKGFQLFPATMEQRKSPDKSDPS